MTADGAPGAEIQRAYFDHADAERFRWTTSGPGFAECEDELLAPLLGLLEAPCLEMGCGEGNNLVRLTRATACVGIDSFVPKLRFARRALPETRFAASDAAALPFPDAHFASVFVRDLLHHLPAPERALAEAFRVLRPGGRFVLLEPNGRNPIVWLQTRLVAAEAGARRFGPELLRGWLEAQPIEALRIVTSQPLPLRRLVLHYRMGLPALGRMGPTRGLLRHLEGALGRLLPASRWCYVVATARRA